MMRLALIGDIHAYRRFLPPWLLLGKRLLGTTTLWTWRQFLFDQRLLGPVLNRAASLKPDLLLLSGDVSNTALPAEFMEVRHTLDALLGTTPALTVPGNHDRYTRRAQRRRTLEKLLGRYVPGRFPHFQRLRGRWHLLALDAARPYLTSASGRLGNDQMEAARQQVAALTRRDGLIVLCHYPLFYPPGTHHRPRHSLLDKKRLITLLRGCPARTLYLHGHVHVPWQFSAPDSALEHLTLINAGAPTCRTRRFPQGQGFWQIGLPANPWAGVGLWRHVPARDLTSADNGIPEVGVGVEAKEIEGWTVTHRTLHPTGRVVVSAHPALQGLPA